MDIAVLAMHDIKIRLVAMIMATYYTFVGNLVAMIMATNYVFVWWFVAMIMATYLAFVWRQLVAYTVRILAISASSYSSCARPGSWQLVVVIPPRSQPGSWQLLVVIPSRVRPGSWQ